MVRKMLRRALDLYLAALGAWALAWVAWRDRKGVLGLINAWAFWLLAPALPLGALGLWGRGMRKFFSLAWLAGSSALLAYRYPWLRRLARRAPEPFEHPDEGQAGPGLPALRIMSLNILKENENAGAVLCLIRREAPDVVLIQELEPAMNRALQAGLDGYDYCHWQCHPWPGGAFGFFSRYPFELTGIWDSPATRPYAARITVTTPAGQVDLYNVHLLSIGPSAVRKTGLTGNFRIREMQMVTLADSMLQRRMPALALGDYNMTEGNQAYRIAAKRLRDAWLVAGRGPGWTWPRADFTPGRPVLRLDYCFCTPDVQPTAMRVLYDHVGSDHCPIVVDARLAAD